MTDVIEIAGIILTATGIIAGILLIWDLRRHSLKVGAKVVRIERDRISDTDRYRPVLRFRVGDTGYEAKPARWDKYVRYGKGRVVDVRTDPRYPMDIRTGDGRLPVIMTVIAVVIGVVLIAVVAV